MKKYGLFIGMIISLVCLVIGLSFSAAVADDAVVVVKIEGSAFSPETVVVKVGGEVVWKNMDTVTHTVTANDGSFDSGAMQQGDEFRRKFTSAGIIKYSCDNHAYMSGKIEVR